jgi:aspartyl-tRNA(Asn)/glutamyl-tRNA(Gln) amidotransferase subunit C
MEKKDVEHLAQLARIAITDKEAESLAKDMTSILGYISDIEKITGSKEKEKVVGPLFNVMREDTDAHEPGIYSEDLLNLMPERHGDYLKVKKILGENK